MKLLKSIILTLLAACSFSAQSSVLVYGIDYKNSIFKVEDASYYASVLVEGDIIEINIDNSTSKSAKVIDVVSDDKLILKVDDVSLIHHGMRIDIVENTDENEELDYDQETSQNYDDYKYINSDSNFSYRLSSSGLRSYFEDELYKRDRSAYNKLNSKLILLETRSNFGTLIGGVGLFVGGGMVLLAGSVDESDKLSPEDEKQIRVLGLQGLAILFIGAGIGKALIPEKYEYVNLVNRINSLVSKDSLKFEGERVKKDRNHFGKEKLSFIGNSQSMSIQYSLKF